MDRTNNFNVKAKQFTSYLTGIPIFQRCMKVAVAILVPRRRMGAGVVVINEHGQVLLLKHAFHGKHPWGVPGGWMNRGEAPARAAMRELKEETNLDALLGPVVHLDGGPEFNQIDAIYLATQPEGDISLSFEIISAEWFAPNQLPDGMTPKTRQIITAAINAHNRDQQRELQPQ